MRVFAAVVVIGVFLAGCSLLPPPGPPGSRDRIVTAPVADSGVREVRAGDTLYSIAWESGHDFKELADWNDIDPPYLIKPGQQLRLAPPRDAKSRTTKSTSPAAKEPPAKVPTHVVVRGETLYSIAKKRKVRHQDLAAWNNIKPPYALRTGQALRLTPPGSAKTTAVARAAPSAKTGAPDTDDGVDDQAAIKWSWPTQGSIIARFAATGTNKGIDIAGSAGQPIRAAAPGKVVYQGSGLRGYGQLIIVKHNSEFLSAYAHCGATYVKEASVIKPGHVICTMGDSGTDRIKLHFEIRRRGVPVDPMDYLPKT